MPGGFTFNLTTGYQFTETEVWTPAKFNLLGQPSATVTGGLDAVDDYAEISATAKTFTVADLAGDILEATAHGLANGRRVRVSNAGGALPAGLLANQDYYARLNGDFPADRFTLHHTYLGALANDARVNVTDNGSGTQTVAYTVYATGVPLVRNTGTGKWERGIVDAAALPEAVGATAGLPGARGAVPQPGPGEIGDYLARDMTFKPIPTQPDLSGIQLFLWSRLF